MAERRLNYEQGSLDEAEVAKDPFEQFSRWFEETLAAGVVVEPNAMTVATVSGQGQPSARIVLLRAFDERGFMFYTNYDSRKGRELDTAGKAGLLFYWAPLERQIRIDGTVSRAGSDESDSYFASRPRGHRLSAWASPQSETVPDRSYLEARMQSEDERFAHTEVPRPPHWGGYRVAPLAFEFWQGRRNRVHDRLAYTREGDGWRIARLAP